MFQAKYRFKNDEIEKVVVTIKYIGGENMFEELFYKRLTELRNRKGVSARDMSLSIGQNAGYINGLENKKGLPSMSVFFYICDYLKITPEEFFDTGKSDPECLKELLAEAKTLSPEKLRLVVELMRCMK